MTLLEDLGQWSARLRLDDVPARVVELAKSQVISHLAAASAGLRHPVGSAVRTVFGPPFASDARATASVLAGLTSFLQADDTAYAGHLSNSTVSVPMAYAYHNGADGEALLGAVIAANESDAARITAAATLGPHRGQAALHTHLVGAVAGRLHVERADPRRWVDAWSLALSAPPWPLLHGLFDGQAKVLAPVFPLRIGLDACDAAAVGLGGPADILEHPDGFLARFADMALPEAVTKGLGQRWHTETLSFKLRPGGPGIDAAVDAALRLHARHGPFAAADVAGVSITTSIYTLLFDQRASRYRRGSDSPLAALLLAAAYPVASALLRGRFEVEDLHLPAVADAERWELVAKVRVGHDEGMTRDALLSTAPLGEALREAGARARPWLEQVGGQWLADLHGPPDAPVTTFATATKVTPARVEVTMADGRRWTDEVRIPAGAAGPDTARSHRQLVREKLLRTGCRSSAVDVLDGLETLGRDQLRGVLDEIFARGRKQGPVGATSGERRSDVLRMPMRSSVSQ